MCAWVAGPVSFAKVSFHLSLLPLSVPLNRPCAAAFLTTCFGTSCPDDRAAVQTVVRVAAADNAVSARAQTTPAATSVTSFLIASSLRWLDLPSFGVLQEWEFAEAATAACSRPRRAIEPPPPQRKQGPWRYRPWDPRRARPGCGSPFLLRHSHFPLIAPTSPRRNWDHCDRSHSQPSDLDRTVTSHRRQRANSGSCYLESPTYRYRLLSRRRCSTTHAGAVGGGRQRPPARPADKEPMCRAIGIGVPVSTYYARRSEQDGGEIERGEPAVPLLEPIAGARYGPISDRSFAVESVVEWLPRSSSTSPRAMSRGRMSAVLQSPRSQTPRRS